MLNAFTLLSREWTMSQITHLYGVKVLAWVLLIKCGSVKKNGQISCLHSIWLQLTLPTPTCLILFLTAQSFLKTAYYDEQCPVHGLKPSNTWASFAKYFRPPYRPRTEPDQNMRHTLNQFENYPLLQHSYSNTNIKKIKLNFSSTAVDEGLACCKKWSC